MELAVGRLTFCKPGAAGAVWGATDAALLTHASELPSRDGNSQHFKLNSGGI